MKVKTSPWVYAGMCLLALGFLAGCQTETPSTPPAAGGNDKEHKHDENAHVGHEHGPNGGEVVHLAGADYALEWERDETGLVTFYLLDKDHKNVTETDAAELTIETKVGDKETKYTLPRVASESETAKTTKFQITDKALVTSLTAPEGVTNTVKITLGGKEFNAPVKHDPEHDHH
jgi:hypothetical protein